MQDETLRRRRRRRHPGVASSSASVAIVALSLSLLLQTLLMGRCDAATATVYNEDGAAACVCTETTTNLYCSSRRVEVLPPLQNCTALTSIFLGGNRILEIDISTFQGLTNLKYLNLDGNVIKSLPNSAFATLEGLETLSLGSNAIATVAAEMFVGLTALKSLHLYGNLITSLPANALAGLTSLQTLELNANPLRTFDAAVVVTLTNLKKLDLSAAGLTSIGPNSFAGLNGLQVLKLSANTLTVIDQSAFADLTSLTELSLASSKISTLSHGMFTAATSLNVLDLTDNLLSNLDAATFIGLTELKQLYMSANKLTVLQATLFNDLTKLTSLNLGVNPIESLPPNLFSSLTSLTSLAITSTKVSKFDSTQFTALTQLTSLSLGTNLLTELGPKLFNSQTQLRTLTLQANKIQSIDATAFQGLSALETLQLHLNRLTFIAASTFTSLENLDELELDENAITSIDVAAFSKLTALTSLSLADNLLTEVPDGLFDSQTQLSTLVLSRNNISSVAQGAFDATTSLRVLFFSDNAMTEVPPLLMQHMSSLSTLEMRNNLLAKLGPDSFTGLTSLGILRLSQNRLTRVPQGSFTSLTRLFILDLGYNQIDAIDEEAFTTLTQLEELSLNDNNLAQIGQVTLQPLTSLEELDLTNNAVESTQNVHVLHQTSLKRLYLSGNRVSMLPQDAFPPSLTRLSQLDLVDNQITSIHGGAFALLTSLNRLDISGNKVDTLLPDHFVGLTNLEILDVSSNLLAAVAADLFSGITTLQELDFSANVITIVAPTALASLTALINLRLASNFLTEVDGSLFASNTRLQFVSLASNAITTVPESLFSGLTRLTTVQLERNTLTQLPGSIFSSATSFQALIIHGNALTSLPEVPPTVTQLTAHDNAISTIPPAYCADVWAQYALVTMGNNPSVCERVFDPAAKELRVVCDCAAGFYGTENCQPIQGFVTLPLILTHEQPQTVAHSSFQGGQFTFSTQAEEQDLRTRVFDVPLSSGDFVEFRLSVTASAFDFDKTLRTVVIPPAGLDTPLEEHGTFEADINPNVPTALTYQIADNATLPSGVTMVVLNDKPQLQGAPSESGLYTFTIVANDAFSGESKAIADVVLNVSDCGSDTCKNNGTCVDTGNPYDGTYLCECTEGFRGAQCTTEFDKVTGSSTSSASSPAHVYASAAGAVVLVSLLMLGAYLRYRRKMLRKQRELREEIERMNQRVATRVARQLGFTNVEAQERAFDALELHRRDITTTAQLGKGAFGVVELAELKGENVAVKQVLEGAKTDEQEMFLMEARLLHALAHPRIVKMLGHVVNDYPLLIVVEFWAGGDLLQHLKACRPDAEDGPRTQITGELAMHYSYQVADAMAFLELRKVVHRDLAARNILVSDDGTKVCLSDFGMSRTLRDGDYYRRDELSKVPVRWTAPESLRDKTWTFKSDVWSFGVLCWEIATLGASPYGGLTNLDVVFAIAAGHRLLQPDGCADSFYAIMKSCWAAEPNDRPHFQELCHNFQAVLPSEMQELPAAAGKAPTTHETSFETTFDIAPAEATNEYADLLGSHGNAIRAFDEDVVPSSNVAHQENSMFTKQIGPSSFVRTTPPMFGFGPPSEATGGLE